MPERLQELFDALVRTGIPFALEAWNEKPDGDVYGVMSIDTPGGLSADDGVVERIHRGTVYLITFRACYEIADAIERVMGAHTDAFELTEMRYFNEIEAYRRAYSFEVV